MTGAAGGVVSITFEPPPEPELLAPQPVKNKKRDTAQQIKTILLNIILPPIPGS
jgi:hypothetical protein